MKNILITGGSAGIGNELVKSFSANKNWKVVTCSRNKMKNDILKSHSESIDAYTTDLGINELRQKFVREICTRYKFDVIILNAAVSGISKIDKMESTEDYVRNVNYIANQEIIDANIESLRITQGQIIFISSGITEETDYDPEIKLYIETKKATERYLIELSNEPENSSIKFTIVKPGMTATRLHENILSLGSGKLFQRTKRAVEQNKLRNPYIIAKIIKNLVIYREFSKELVFNIDENTYNDSLEN